MYFFSLFLPHESHQDNFIVAQTEFLLELLYYSMSSCVHKKEAWIVVIVFHTTFGEIC